MCNTNTCSECTDGPYLGALFSLDAVYYYYGIRLICFIILNKGPLNRGWMATLIVFIAFSNS